MEGIGTDEEAVLKTVDLRVWGFDALTFRQCTISSVEQEFLISTQEVGGSNPSSCGNKLPSPNG